MAGMFHLFTHAMCKASDEERDMRNGHILPQSTHGRHLVAVYGMDDATRSRCV